MVKLTYISREKMEDFMYRAFAKALNYEVIERTWEHSWHFNLPGGAFATFNVREARIEMRVLDMSGKDTILTHHAVALG